MAHAKDTVNALATMSTFGASGLFTGAVIAGGFSGLEAMADKASGRSRGSVLGHMATEAAWYYVGGKVIGGAISKATPYVKGMIGRTRGTADSVKIHWVDERASMNPSARIYNDSAFGARSNAITKNGQAPALEWTGLDKSSKTIRFDGAEGNVLIDRKLAIVTTEKAKNQALRQSEALRQNGLRGRWEVPDTTQQSRAMKMFEQLNVTNIEAKVVHVPKTY